ncbi:MAG: choice-of-anchor D domain-containing protein [Terriglobales bacterium]
MTRNPPPWVMRTRQIEVALKGHRFDRRLVISLVIAGGLLLLTGCQGLSAGTSSTSPVSLGTGSLNFGTVPLGSSKTLTDTLVNHTTSPVTINAIQGLNSQFQVTGITLPLVLAAGQSAPFSVEFQPADPGDPTITLSFAGSNATYASLSISGTGATFGKLSPNPSQIAFGNIKVGSNQTTAVTLANSGGTDLTINQATLSGAGFAMSNLATPFTLKAGSSASVTITFAPTGAGNFSGSVAFATSTFGKNSTVILNFTGDGITPGVLTPSPSSLAFGSVQVGTNSSKTETLTNTGGSTVNITQVVPSGSGFSFSGLTLPLPLAVNQSVTFNVIYTPTSAGAGSGTLNIVSNASNSSLSIPLSGTGLAAGALTATPASVSFGNVTVGKSQTTSVQITNTGGEAVTLSSAVASGSGFSVTGQTPITLNAGQSTTFNAIFTPAAAGAASGTLTINSNASNATLSVPLSGTGVAQGQLGSDPTSFSFGNVQVGSSKSLTGTLTNSGGSSLTISAAAASGTGFSLSGLAPGLTLAAGQSTSFTVLFSPTASGAASGNVNITSNGINPNLSIPLSGTGVTQGTLAANPTSLAFGNVQVGSSTNLSETLTNTGGSSLTISAAAASGTGFSLSGLASGLTLAAGQSTSFTVTFDPSASGAASGNVSITSTGSDSSLSIPLSGTGMTAGALAANPTSLAFSSTQVGSSTNLSETLTNTGGSTVAISAANVTGAAFSISGLSGFPINLTSGQSVTFTATFTPTSAGAASGSLSVVSNASNSPLNITLSGTGTASGTLAVSPTSLSFGNVVVGSSSALNGSLTAGGTSVTVTSASLNNSEFVLSGFSPGVTIAAGQSISFTVTFTPQASGATSASLSFASNASNSPAVQSMTGTGTAQTQHTVDLSWTASADAVGYNIYRGTVSGGPYTMINSSLDGTTAYTDNTVVSGQTYYYVTTAVDSESQESGYSNQAQAIVPTP